MKIGLESNCCNNETLKERLVNFLSSYNQHLIQSKIKHQQKCLLAETPELELTWLNHRINSNSQFKLS